VLSAIDRFPMLNADVCQRALRARDPRFDGLFFVGITTTRIYCRPVCPARVTYADRRRFFNSAAAAECAGFRPCLRCRPELAPGRALCDAVSRLAYAATLRIGAGALNGRSVAELARELCVGERHLRRALERELGVSPVELAQTHRLLLAKRLLVDTDLPVTRIAFASGFQSLRRFNTVFRERYRMPPSALRATRRAARGLQADPKSDLVRLTLAYRPPLAWDVLVALLARGAVPGVEMVAGRRYGRTFRLGEFCGVVFAEDGTARNSHVNIDVSASLVPVLMPLLARLRHFLDLDAQPAAVDAHLAQAGLGAFVRQLRGLRIPGALDGFDVALQTLLSSRVRPDAGASSIAHHVARELGEPIDTGIAALDRLAPSAERVADAGAARLVALGVTHRRADAIATVAQLVADGTLRLEPGCDVVATQRALAQIAGVGDALATMIVMRALYWPDAFPVSDRALQRAAGVSSARALLARAEPWRPWRAYAALHLWLSTFGNS
jgi:AraC family transcriptional regulator of adaptative response / DNA-3-methyladenine glycosylase II